MARWASAKQIWLLSYENPLSKRLGSDFFKKLPQSPGVYWMLGPENAVLYVGKAKNLKKRLQSYQRAKPEQCARKTLRMIHLVTEIRWEECESEVAALLRENYLLRTWQPPFNVMNTHPESYYFIAFGRKSASQFGFRLTTAPTEDADHLFGVFKGRGLIRKGYSALLRLLWMAFSTDESENVMYPGVLSRRKIPYRYQLAIQRTLSPMEMESWEKNIYQFLAGRSKKLLSLLMDRLLEKQNLCPFLYGWIQEDFEILSDFYKWGPRRTHKLKEFHQLKEPFLSQECIDDLIVTYKNRLK